MGKGPWSMNEASESFCRGVHAFGPFHDHVLCYWKESLKRPEKVLFLRYEDMKKDPKGQLKKMASFLGKPFAKEEEVNKVLWRCSLERLKNLEVNQHGVDPWLGIDYKFYSGVVMSGIGKTTSLKRLKKGSEFGVVCLISETLRAIAFMTATPARPKTKTGGGGQINSKPEASTNSIDAEEVGLRTALDIGKENKISNKANVGAAVTVKTAENN
ncbi:hypothetical protein CRYUN_Cryun38cG0035500 [Craigia yunnanensis]